MVMFKVTLVPPKDLYVASNQNYTFQINSVLPE